MTSRLDINIFTYRDDSEVLSSCIRGLTEVFPEAWIHIIDDAATPIPGDCREKMTGMSDRIEYRQSHFNRQGNLNGKECILGMLDQYLKSSQGQIGYTMKVDCDTLIFGRDWYDEFVESGLRCLGSSRPGSVMSGICYVLSNNMIPDIIDLVRSANINVMAAEDMTIGGAAIMLSSPRFLYQIPAQRKECPFGNWCGYNYTDYIRVADLHKFYSVVTFGNYYMFGLSKSDRTAAMTAALQGWLDYSPTDSGTTSGHSLTYRRRPDRDISRKA